MSSTTELTKVKKVDLTKQWSPKTNIMNPKGRFKRSKFFFPISKFPKIMKMYVGVPPNYLKNLEAIGTQKLGAGSFQVFTTVSEFAGRDA